MKLGKAPELVKRMAAVLKSKTGVVLGAKLLVQLASFRRRMAAVGTIPHRMQALVVAAADREKAGKAAVDCHTALVVVPRRASTVAAAMGEKPVAAVTADISSQLALFDQEDGGGDGHDWTHALFNDDDDGDCCYAVDEYEVGGDEDDEPPVMEVIRSNREVEGLEFNVEDEIDQAADMFIRRFRERMNRSF